MLADRVRMASYKGRGQLIDRTTPRIVVNQPYSIEGNGGRKLVRLSNGWLVCALKNSTSNIQFYCSKDNGLTWNQIAWWGPVNANDFSISSNGTMVYLLSNAGGGIRFISFNAITVSNISSLASYAFLADTVIERMSLTINPQGTELHACWSSKTATYPNSFNIRYSKGAINGDGSVTWGSVEQVTRMNNTSINMITPSIVITNSIPVILIEGSSTRNLQCLTRDSRNNWGASLDSNWGFTTVFSLGSTYPQSSPSACVDKDGVIPVAWYGTDSTHPSTNYIRISKSLDNGVTWSTMKKIVQGINPSLTTDRKGNYYIEYQDGSMVKRIQSSNKGETWSNPITLDASTNPSTLYDNKFELDFEVPLSIRQTSSSVIFSGKWYE